MLTQSFGTCTNSTRSPRISFRCVDALYKPRRRVTAPRIRNHMIVCLLPAPKDASSRLTLCSTSICSVVFDELTIFILWSFDLDHHSFHRIPRHQLFMAIDRLCAVLRQQPSIPGITPYCKEYKYALGVNRSDLVRVVPASTAFNSL